MYKTKLNIKETQYAIEYLRHTFQSNLSKKLNLTRVTAPLFINSDSMLNDGLNGEKPVQFRALNIEDKLEIIHSLSKWKRMALYKYGFEEYTGIYTDMNAVRRQEILDYTHSFYVDQWDWEYIINRKDFTLSFLHKIVKKIYAAMKTTESQVNKAFPILKNKLPKEITFITSQALLELYPELSPEEREYEFVKANGAIFVSQIGWNLSNKAPHGRRAFDYDDWKLNGDIIVYDAVNDAPLELSSMGIRVRNKTLKAQYEASDIDESMLGKYHFNIFNKILPFTIGGGIGQSRLSMFLLEKKHIGEVQASVWPKELVHEWKKEGIELL